MADAINELDQSGTNALELASHVFALYFAGTGLELAGEVKSGRFYLWRVPIQNAAGEYCGVIELGGANTVRKDGTYTVRCELTGAGATAFRGAGSGHAKRWLELRAKLESTAGRLTRLDACIDDLQGKFPISMVQQWYRDGLFDRRGQKPKARLFDDFDSGDGKTFYVGTKTSEHQLRAYEKGRELGDPDSPWVRFEVEFRASTRKELPLDMLRDPGAYMLGAYPVLRMIEAIARRIDVTNPAMAATWKSARRHLKRQYGRTLAFIRKHTDDAGLVAVVMSCTASKLPAWACTDAAKQWPEILAESIEERERRASQC